MKAAWIVAVWMTVAVRAWGTDVATRAEPRTYTYREIDGRSLSAYVFAPTTAPAESISAILLFHGGGWSSGAAEWTFDTARRFAGWGLVAISIQYRLSEGAVTPIDALDDVCAALAWVRDHAGDLGFGGHVVGYGVSAGGHLITLAATRGCGEDPRPDALLLWSPALDVTRDGWFAKKLQGRASVQAYSPVEHVTAATPPTSIVHGVKDTLTPLAGAQRFCELVVAAGGTCELNAYENVGHLLTRNLQNPESDFDPDPEARAAGIAKQREFLVRLGLIAKP
jgi:acetyl esterase/lipase